MNNEFPGAFQLREPTKGEKIMKEFIYTCEYCGSEYSISKPGTYECSTCNNTFNVEDPQEEEKKYFQEQEKKMEEIRKKALEEKDKEKNKKNEKNEKMDRTSFFQKKKKYKCNVGLYTSIFISFIFFIITVVCICFSVIEEIAKEKKKRAEIYKLSIKHCITMATLHKNTASFYKEEAEKILNIAKKYENYINEYTDKAKSSRELAKSYREDTRYDFKKSAQREEDDANSHEESVKYYKKLRKSNIDIAKNYIDKEKKETEEQKKYEKEEYEENKKLSEYTQDNAFFLKQKPYPHTITLYYFFALLISFVSVQLFHIFQIIEYNTRKEEK